MKPPAFQFYADDFVGGVADMTQCEVGAYILLLCHQWSRGEIPTDTARVALIAKGEASPHVLAKFPGGKNERLERVRKEREEFVANCQQAGKSGGGNPAFRKGQPNPYYQKDKGGDKGQDKGGISFEDKGRDKGRDIGQDKGRDKPEINSPSPSPSPIYIERVEAEIPSLTEIKAYASMHGIKPEQAQAFYDHNEGNQLWVNRHGVAVNWKHKLTVWAANDRAKPVATSPGQSGTAESILRQKELEDVKARIKSAESIDDHRDYTPEERAKIKALKLRKKELESLLGWKV